MKTVRYNSALKYLCVLLLALPAQAASKKGSDGGASKAKSTSEVTTTKVTKGSKDGENVEDKVVCPSPLPKVPKISLRDVYKGMPFQPGEKATYLLTWAGLEAGYGTLEVRKPTKHKGVWHRVFQVDAQTGDWFKTVFIAKEHMSTLSRPWDFGVSRFYMEQNEGKLFSKPFQQKKWLEFNHNKCKVHEETVRPGRETKKEDFDLAYGAIDAVGVIYKLRTIDFKLGEKQKALVYTSKENWWLEADPVAFEKVTVPGGTFETVKLKLQTYLGQELQQKGEVYAWVATKTSERQLVQLQGEIKIGSVWVKLHKYEPGKAM